MDENEIQVPEELSEFSLEDIIREVGTFDDDETLHDLAVRELMEDIPQKEFLEDAPLTGQGSEQEEPEVLVWTPGQRSEAPQSAGDTIRIDTNQVKAQAA